MKTKQYLLALVLALSIIPAANAIGWGINVDPNVVLYVKLDANGTATDSSQYSRNGTLINSPTFNATGGILQNGSYRFNGSNQYITFSGTAATMLNATNGFTTCGFISFNDLKNFSNMFGKLTDGAGANSLTDFGMYGETNTVRGKIGNGTAATTIAIQSNPSVNNNTWYCLNYNTTHLKGYVNGVNTVSTIKSFTGEVSQARDFQIGFSSNAARYGNITADEIVVWNISLTDGQIQDIWNNYNDCFNITENYNATINTRFCSGTYYLNDTDLDGVITIGTPGITIDGNGAYLVGNLTNNSKAIYLVAQDNVILMNFKIENYSSGIEINNADGGLINNNTIKNSTQQIYIRTTSNDWTVSNNTINDSETYGVYISNSDRINIFNNYFSNVNNPNFGTTVTNTVKGFIATDSTSENYTVYSNEFSNAQTNYIRVAGSGFNISYNNFTGKTIYDNTSNDSLYHVYRQIWCDSGLDGIVSYNNFTGAQYSVFTTDTCNRISVVHNDIHQADIGARIGGYNIYFYNNTIRNVTPHYDGYDLGLKVNEGVNITVANNRFTESPTGIWVTASNNTIIANNTIIGIPFSERPNYNASDDFDQLAAIRITKTFKSWKTEGNEFTPPSNMSTLSVLNSSGATIYNNTIQYYPLILWLEGASNVTNDFLPGQYWLIRSQFPAFIYNIQEMYYANDTEQSRSYNAGVISTLLKSGYRGRYYINYSINKYWQYYENMNQTLLVNQVQTVVPQNLTNAIIYFKNNTLACNNIVLCDNSITLSIAARQYAYVLDNYSLIEYAPRNNSPLTISSVSNYKVITSSLVETAYNVTTVVLASSLPVSPMLQHSNYSENVSGVYDPGAGTFTFTATITPGDNILYLNGATIDGIAAAPVCQEARDSLGTFATWLTTLAIVLALGLILYIAYSISNGTLNIDTELIIKAGVGLVVAGLFITIGYIIVSAAASTCV